MRLSNCKELGVLTLVTVFALALGGCGGGGGSTALPSPATLPGGTTAHNVVPHSSHVVLVIEENHTFSEVYSGGMPWLVAQGNQYGYAANYRANVPGSLLDYLWLSSGSGEQQFGCNGDNCG